MNPFRLITTIIMGASAVIALGAITITRGEGVDIAWASDLIFEIQSTIWGLLISGVVIWLVPLEWRDAYRKDLPFSVRASIPLALAIIMFAIMSSMGTL